MDGNRRSAKERSPGLIRLKTRALIRVFKHKAYLRLIGSKRERLVPYVPYLITSQGSRTPKVIPTQSTPRREERPGADNA